MKLAGVCIVLLALATASYATPYHFEERQGQQVEEQMMDPSDSQGVMDETHQMFQQLQKENQAQIQQDIGKIITSLLGGFLG